MTIPGSLSSPLLASATGAAPGAFEVSRSLRFDSSASSYLNRTPSSAGNRKTWTWSCWIKRNNLSSAQNIFVGSDNPTKNNTTHSAFYFHPNNKIYFGGWNSPYIITDAVYRDASAWYHIVLSVDTAQSTSADRIKVYVNNVLQSYSTGAGFPGPNTDLGINQAHPHYIGGNDPQSGYASHMYAEINFIDGSALDPTSFGEFDDSGVWQAKDTSGLSFGTNGFRLKFADNSSNAALGTDSSGSSNTWTVNNLTASTSPDYSLYVSGSVAGSPYDATKMFDGSLTTYTDHGSANSTITWTYTLTSVTSLRVYIHGGNSTNTVTTVGGSGTQADTISTDFGPGWHTISLSNTGSTINSIAFTRGGSGNPLSIYAIEVNSVVYIAGGSHTDSLVDTPTNAATPSDSGIGGEVVGNYATMSPVGKTKSEYFTEDGNLTCGNSSAPSGSSGNRGYVPSTIGFKTGKWYCECVTTRASDGDADFAIGIFPADSTGYYSTSGHYAVRPNGTLFSPAGTAQSYGSSWADGDVIGIKVDLDSSPKTIQWFKNNVAIASAITIADKEYFFGYGSDGGGGSRTYKATWNFGQRAFAYTAPSGYKSLNTANLPTPTIADGSKYFDADLYTGTGSALERSNLSFNPDFLWFKQRSGSSTSHALFDVIRGGDKRLVSNGTNEEVDVDQFGGGVTSFDSDGFTLGTWTAINASSETYVAWAWDAGTSTVSNTDGTGTTNVQVRANTAAGFSIVTYTGGSSTPANSDSGDSFGHGLGVAPQLVICKKRTGANSWPVYHASTTLGALVLDGTNALDTTSFLFAKKHPTNSVVYLGNNPEINNSSHNYVAYCFASVLAFSSIGTYSGNGSDDGPFVYTGFKPRLIITRAYSSNSNNNSHWLMYDTLSDSNPYNEADTVLYANLSNPLNTNSSMGIDILSNGFKLKADTSGYSNYNGWDYLYYAVAENPFQANGGLAR